MGENRLDMRMDKSQELTAEKVVNEYPEDKLLRIIYEYGEERFAKNIVRNIVKQRKIKPIETTNELVKIIEESIPKAKQNNGHPAKRTFQAIRIEVNDEIRPLYNTVINSINCLKKNGRLCIITFHSLEDRAVKEAFKDAMRKMYMSKELPYCVCNYKSLGKIINKKPIVAKRRRIKRKFKVKKCKTKNI